MKTTDIRNESEGQLDGVGGLRLYYHAWEGSTARAALLVVHGLAEHGLRYRDFGRRLVAANVNVYALDLRGHGRSDGRRGHVERFELFLQDLDRFRREVEAITERRLPLFLLGHSMGGLIVLRYLQEYESSFRGAVVVSPWLATAMPVPRWKVLLASALNRVLPALPLRTGINPDHLSHNAAVVNRYREDALVHHRVTPRLFAEAATAMGLVAQHSERLRLPLLFLLAGDDRIVDSRRAEAFARSLGDRDVLVRLFPDYYHEVLNDHDRSTVAREISEWVLARA